MLKRVQLFPLNFYKKQKFNGSIGKMNFRLEQMKKETETVLLGTVWEGPFCYDKTPKEKFVVEEFPFSEEGICAALEWFNEKGNGYNKIS